MQLLKTKFHIPDFNKTSCIRRDSINGILSLKNRQKQIVVISAPAGFGKTTLLSEWIHLDQGKTAWLSLDHLDNSLELFWNYVIGAVMTVSPDTGGETRELINTPGLSSLEDALISFINELSDAKGEISLILDDYHVITESGIHESLEFFLDHMPGNIRILIASREDPNLSMSRFRVSGKMLEVREKDLRFDQSETSEFLNNIHKLNLDVSSIHSLHQKTEGWIAGLMLAVLSMGESRDNRRFIHDFSGDHRYILDYLVDEVLAGIPENIKEFILNISVLERFSPDLCTAVTDEAESPKHIAFIEKNNLFLVPLDSSRTWYRYHHLFREFLLKKQSDENPERISSLHEKAFRWFKKNDYIQDALLHAIQAGMFQEAASLLSERIAYLYDESGDAAVAHLIKQLPDDAVHSNPELVCYKTWIFMMSGDFSLMHMLDPERFTEDKKGLVSGFKAAIDAYLAFYQDGNFKKSIKYSRLTQDLLDEKHHIVLHIIRFLYAISHRYAGDALTAEELISSMGTQTDNLFYVMNKSDFEIEQGLLRAPLKRMDRFIQKGIERYGNHMPPIYGFLFAEKSHILREQNQLEEAEKLCRKGLEIARAGEFIEVLILGNLEYSKIQASEKRYREAMNTVQKSITLSEETGSWAALLGEAWKMRILMMQGDFEPVKKWIDSSDFLFDKQDEFHLWPCILTLVRYLICHSKTHEAHAILDRMIEEDLRQKRHGRLLECYILKSISFYLEKKTDESMNMIGKAFQNSEKEGYKRLFLDEGDLITKVFSEASKRQILPDYLKADSEETGTKEDGRLKSVIIHDFKEEFNEREIDVLSLMKKGNSNKKIADTLFLSVNTVRWYASRIFAKLDVKGRGEAVAAAEAYKLI